MSQAIRDAAQAVLDAGDMIGTVGAHDRAAAMRTAIARLRAALSAPQPTADDAVPVVAWLYTESGHGACEPKCYISKAAVDHACEVFNGTSEPLIRQRDHIATVSALQQQQLGECTGGYETMEREVAALKARIAELEKPIDMVLHCPKCGMQHIDRDEGQHIAPHESPTLWRNPPHCSHLCHKCGFQWRPADVATNGVAAVKTKGKDDSPIVQPRRDSDRLDWMQFHSAHVAWGSGDEVCSVDWSDRDGRYRTALFTDWRAAIDAAMGGHFREVL